jgi:hypothetical protein
VTIKRVDRTISSEQSIRPSFKSGWSARILCDASYHSDGHLAGLHVECEVYDFAARTVFRPSGKLDEPFICAAESKIILPIDIGDIDDLGVVVRAISDSQFRKGCQCGLLRFGLESREQRLHNPRDRILSSRARRQKKNRAD